MPLNRRKKRLKYMRKVQVLFPNEKLVFFNQALNFCYLPKPDYAACKDNLLKAKALDPHNFDTNYALGLVTLKNRWLCRGKEVSSRSFTDSTEKHRGVIFVGLVSLQGWRY